MSSQYQLALICTDGVLFVTFTHLFRDQVSHKASTKRLHSFFVCFCSPYFDPRFIARGSISYSPLFYFTVSLDYIDFTKRVHGKLIPCLNSRPPEFGHSMFFFSRERLQKYNMMYNALARLFFLLIKPSLGLRLP